MAQRKYPVIAREGWPFILAVLLLAIAAIRLGGVLLVLPALGLLLLLVLLFRDPQRDTPARPLGIVSPVDGKVLSVAPTDKGALNREAIRIVVKIDHFGAYTARSPTEGRILNLRDNLRAGSRLLGIGGLWLRTDEGDDVVVLMRGHSRFVRPRSFVGYGERLGQGHRFAFIRLARLAEIYLPLASRPLVKAGDRVQAGSDQLAELVHD
jgi:phosphatidylserine decarboxylase